MEQVAAALGKVPRSQDNDSGLAVDRLNRHGRQGDLDPVGQQRSVIGAQDPVASVGQSVGAQAPITPLSREGQHRRLGSDRSEVLGDRNCGDLAGGHHAAH